MSLLDPEQMAFATKCIHAGLHPDKETGAIMTPIYQSSTYLQDGPGEHRGYEYSRSSNPTRTALEKNIAALEGAKYGFCLSSGCAATTSIVLCLSSGDHIIAMDDLYGGTRRIFERVFDQFGIESTFVDLTDKNKLEGAIKSNTKLLWIETPTNPMLKVVDLAQCTDIAKKNGIKVAVDNTVATPYLQKPLELGADLVVHSTTKYMGGHSDVVGGAIATNDSELAEKLKFIINATGPVPAPFDVFLILRGIKTLHVRVQRHSENAMALARLLQEHGNVENVYYPGLESHPQHSIAKSQMKAAGGLLSFVVKGGQEKAVEVLKKTKVFACAESLGGVESLIEHPAIMTHASVPQSIRQQLGIEDGLIRLSAGLENVEDLKTDLLNALNFTL